MSEEAWAMSENARRVLQAAGVEAYGRAGVYAQRDPAMQRVNISDLEELRIIARYLDEKDG